MILEGLFSEDVLIANANQQLEFKFYEKNVELLSEEKRKYQCKYQVTQIKKSSMSC